MSGLVAAYGSSDEESDVEENQPSTSSERINGNLEKLTTSISEKPEYDEAESVKPNLHSIPKPKPSEINSTKIEEVDDVPLYKKVDYSAIEKPPPKYKGRAQITIPSLAEFEDLDNEQSQKYQKQPSKKGSSLLSTLPPPSHSSSKKLTAMVPHTLTKKVPERRPTAVPIPKVAPQIVEKFVPKTDIKLSQYDDSSSDEENDSGTSKGIDFFLLSTPIKISQSEAPVIPTTPDVNVECPSDEVLSSTEKKSTSDDEDGFLTSTVMNLTKNEIIAKNKSAEVGPKLPLPEQEYRVDSSGNVAFDDKAIEYLCGRRGVKRKQELGNIEIVEINGEDNKPDEREWMVKALTEETARPASYGAGPSGTSKRKHQITYLAHQAKANELDLKNQWAQNRFNKQQTRSKYGF